LELRIDNLKLRVPVVNLRMRVLKRRIEDSKLLSGVLKLQIDDPGPRSLDVSRYMTATYVQMAGMGAGRQRFLRPIRGHRDMVEVPFRQTVPWRIRRFTSTPPTAAAPAAPMLSPSVPPSEKRGFVNSRM
jgi:hypothetical protein